MSTLTTLKDLLFAAELMAGATLIPALAWLVANQSRASARHLTWAGAFGALLALPLLLALVPSLTHIMLAPPPAPAATVAHAVSLASLPPLPPAEEPAFDAATAMLALGALWLAGVGAVLLRLAFAAGCLALLRHRSRVFVPTPDKLPKVPAARRECELRLSDRDAGPITWGLFRPIVLLPAEAVHWPVERWHTVLLHELAHVRRRDCLVQALAHFACALYWPHPLVWFAARRLRREAEMAADDSVIAAGIKPSTYAGTLLELADAFRAQRPLLSSLPLAMAAPSALESRVESVLSPNPSRLGVTSMDIAKIAGVSLVATAALAFACPSLAQEQSPPASVESTPLPAPEAAPPAPVAPVEDMSVPAAPPAPAAAPAAPAPAAAPAPPAPPAPNGDIDIDHGAHRIIVDGRDWKDLTPEERKHVRAEIEHARHEAHEALAKVRPQIEKAMAQVRASEDAVRAAEPAIDAATAEVERHRADIDRAMADTHVREQIMKDVQPRLDDARLKIEMSRADIERALNVARAALAKEHIDVRIQERIDDALRHAEFRIEAGDHDGDRNVEVRTDRHDNNDHGADRRVEDRTDQHTDN